MTPVEFHGDLWHQKTRVHGLSCGVVYVILHLAVLVELRLVTDGLTDTEPWLVPRMHSTAREKTVIYQGNFATNNIFIAILVTLYVTQSDERTKGVVTRRVFDSPKHDKRIWQPGSARTHWGSLGAPQAP